MSDNSKIEWTTHTFNPWWGCARVSPGCRFCYADDLAQRYGQQVWRRHGPRRMLSEANWAKPAKWNRDAERAGVPAKVFCASMADVFEDHPDVTAPRERLWEVIGSTPWLRWQLLTKRPENIPQMAPWGDNWPDNVWAGTSVENQTWADRRIPLLLKIPAAVRFLSCEPLIGPVDLKLTEEVNACTCGTGPSGYYGMHERYCGLEPGPHWGIDWVIIGGESGPKARPMDPAWAFSLIRQARQGGAAPFLKQVGTVAARDLGPFAGRKGGNWEALPDSMRVREFPVTAEAAA